MSRIIIKVNTGEKIEPFSPVFIKNGVAKNVKKGNKMKKETMIKNVQEKSTKLILQAFEKINSERRMNLFVDISGHVDQVVFRGLMTRVNWYMQPDQHNNSKQWYKECLCKFREVRKMIKSAEKWESKENVK